MLRIPTTCPVCNSTLERVKNQLFCRNTECGGKNLEQIKKFTKTMKIMGFGEQTIKKLYIESINEIYELDEEFVREVLGNKMADKLLQEIYKSQTIELSTFLQSMSIPLIGKTASEKVASLNMSLDDIMPEDLQRAGLGEKATDSLFNWIEAEWFDNYDTLPIVFKKSDNQDYKQTICISGKTPGYTKAQIMDILAQEGINTVNTVNSKVQYLISESSTTAKAVKAKELNIPIKGFKQFLKENINNESKVE